MKALNLAVLALAFIGTAAFASDRSSPSRDAYLCFVPESGAVVSTDDFFSQVHNKSQREHSCVVGKVAYKPSSSRLYVDGRRVAKDLGGLSNSEVRAVERDLGLPRGACQVRTCEEYLRKR